VAKRTENANSLIKEFTQMRVADLRTYIRNPRRGNIEAIRASLRANLQYNPITVNIGTHTDRPYEVLRGNHTLLAAREEGWETVDVVLVDIDADQARRVVLVDNKLPEMGTYDIEALTAELQELDDLEGTGYTQEDLDKLLYQDEVDNDPKDSEHEEVYNSRWEIVIQCEDEDHQRETYERLSSEGYVLRILSL
jgi:hypothetical protein